MRFGPFNPLSEAKVRLKLAKVSGRLERTIREGEAKFVVEVAARFNQRVEH